MQSNNFNNNLNKRTTHIIVLPDSEKENCPPFGSMIQPSQMKRKPLQSERVFRDITHQIPTTNNFQQTNQGFPNVSPRVSVFCRV